MTASDHLSEQFGDYTLHFERGAPGWDYHHIEAFHQGSKVGNLSWLPGGTHRVTHVSVDPAHERRSLATAMWNMGQQIRPKPRHSADRTTEGDAWARKVGGRLPRAVDAEGW